MKQRTLLLVREALLNLLARPLVTASIFVLSAGATLAVFWAVNSDVGRIERLHTEQNQRGVNVFMVYSAEPGGVDSSRCDLLMNVDGIVTAGGVISSQQVSLGPGQASRYWRDTVTAGLPTILWPETNAAYGEGLIAGNDIAGQLGLVQGAESEIDGVAYPIAATMPSSPRDDRNDSKLISVAAPSGTVKSCLVEAAAGSSSDVETLLETWFLPTSRVQISPYYVPDQTLSPQQQLHTRPTFFLPILTAIALILLQSALWMTRRSEFALYRLLGFSRLNLLTIIGTEWMLAIMIPALIGSWIFSLLFPMQGVTLQLTLGAIGQYLLALCLAVPLGLLTVSLGSVVKLLKEGN